MRRWLSAIVITSVLVTPSVANAQQQELSVSVVGRGDDAFKELISRFEMKTGIKVVLKFPNFIASRDLIVKGEPFDVGIVEFPHDADVVASGNVVPGSATTVAVGWMAVAVKKGAPKPDISTAAAVKRMLLHDIHRLVRVFFITACWWQWRHFFFFFTLPAPSARHR